MSSREPLPKSLVDLAVGLGDQAYRKAYDTYDRISSDPNRRLPKAVDEHAGNALDLARDIAGLLLHTARSVGEDLIDAAEQLEALVAREGGEDGESAPASEGEEPPVPKKAAPSGRDSVRAAQPASLMLPAVSPGQEASGSFDVRNDSRDHYDSVPMRCGGLFGVGDIRITSGRVTFKPAVVEIDPNGSARVTCTAAVPKSAKRGHYVGMIEAGGLPGVTLLVSLDVI